ncbi:uncharacterized protein Dana_GF27367 [Drosophila ananassae]|uniref:Uncharacterized protein n=1 Tax=Drosophila ananassae TaxID=7217 RepID=A0A0P8YJK1_DROAN|nr:uncharacterized protein Dana_GF27367 [Drosophila ananassae]
MGKEILALTSRFLRHQSHVTQVQVFLDERLFVNKLIEHTTVYKNFKEWNKEYDKGDTARRFSHSSFSRYYWTSVQPPKRIRRKPDWHETEYSFK